MSKKVMNQTFIKMNAIDELLKRQSEVVMTKNDNDIVDYALIILLYIFVFSACAFVLKLLWMFINL